MTSDSEPKWPSLDDIRGADKWMGWARREIERLKAEIFTLRSDDFLFSDTWQLPPSPPLHVTFLRDQWGRAWRRASCDNDYWIPVPDMTKRESQRLTKEREWHTLLSIGGILTDVTPEES